MAKLMDWQLSIDELGYIGFQGSAYFHSRYADGTRITYTTKLDDLDIHGASFVFRSETEEYLVPFSECTGVSDVQFLSGSPVADVFQALNGVNAEASAELFRIISDREKPH